MFSLTKNKKCALANSEGIELTSFKYDKIGYFPYLLEMPPEAKTTKIELNGKYGIINSTGELKEKIDKEIILNGYGDVEVLFSEFVAALKSDDDEVIREFADMIAIDTQTVLMMMRLDLNYRGVPNDIFKRKMLITDFTVDYFSRMIKYRDRLKNDGELASLKNLGPQNLGYGVFSKRYDIPATEVSFTMKSDKRSHDVKLGELIRINGVWKVFTYPRFN